MERASKLFYPRHSGMEAVGVEWEQMRRLALRIELRADVTHHAYNNKCRYSNKLRYEGTNIQK
jgi:hypothetical protein